MSEKDEVFYKCSTYFVQNQKSSLHLMFKEVYQKFLLIKNLTLALANIEVWLE